MPQLDIKEVVIDKEGKEFIYLYLKNDLDTNFFTGLIYSLWKYYVNNRDFGFSKESLNNITNCGLKE